MKKENSIKTYFKDLGLSLVKTKNLLRFCLYSWITPLLTFILISVIISIPPIIDYNSVTENTVPNNILYVDHALAYAFSTDIKCNIKDNDLICDEGYSYVTEKDNPYIYTNKDNKQFKYTIVINKNLETLEDRNFKLGDFGERFNTDNYIILGKESYIYRYTVHDARTESVQETTGIGFYDNLNGMNLHELYEKSTIEANNANIEFDSKVEEYMVANSVDKATATSVLLTERGFTEYSQVAQNAKDKYLLNESRNFLELGFKGFLKQITYNQILTNILFFLVFSLIAALVIKGNFLFKRTKGLKYSHSFKISLVSSLQSILIALLASLLLNMDMMSIFALAITIRILYVYIRYTGSRKNVEWLNDLYTISKDERFNVDYDQMKLTDPLFAKQPKQTCPTCGKNMKIKNNVVYCKHCQKESKK